MVMFHLEMLLKTPEDVNDNEAQMIVHENTIGSLIDGFGTGNLLNYFGEIGEMHFICITIFIGSKMEIGNIASERHEQVEIDVIDIAPDSTSGLEAVENSPDTKPISPEKRSFKALPAPFHVRGRRPSTGCNKMLPITEE